MSILDDKTAQERKDAPVWSGFLNYFPDAVIAVAMLSKIGNDQHNPGQPLHWDRSKSGDEKDALARHLIDAGRTDTDSVLHSTKTAWRAMANLQKELEALQASSVAIAAQAAVDRTNGLPTLAQKVMGEAPPEVKAEWDPLKGGVIGGQVWPR